jgi:hypothetical protein
LTMTTLTLTGGRSGSRRLTSATCMSSLFRSSDACMFRLHERGRS